MDGIEIRRGRPRDYTTLGRILYEAVHYGAPAYTLAQRAAWQPTPKSGPEWNARLGGQLIWVAVAERTGPVGFLTLKPGGYIDYAYILRAWQGRGLFGAMMAPLETYARAEGWAILSTHASLHARPVFARRGFMELRADPVMRDGQELMRFEMEKDLSQPWPRLSLA